MINEKIVFESYCVCQLCLSLHVADIDEHDKASKYSVSGLASVICICIAVYFMVGTVCDIGLRVNQENMEVHIWLFYM